MILALQQLREGKEPCWRSWCRVGCHAGAEEGSEEQQRQRDERTTALTHIPLCCFGTGEEKIKSEVEPEKAPGAGAKAF